MLPQWILYIKPSFFFFLPNWNLSLHSNKLFLLPSPVISLSSHFCLFILLLLFYHRFLILLRSLYLSLSPSLLFILLSYIAIFHLTYICFGYSQTTFNDIWDDHSFRAPRKTQLEFERLRALSSLEVKSSSTKRQWKQKKMEDF